MTAMKPVLELVVDANLVLVVAYGLWWLVRLAARGGARRDYALQLGLIQAAAALVVLSPVLSLAAVWGSQSLWPNTPVTLSDLAVAAFLRGDIQIPAVRFEEILHSGDALMTAVLSGQFPVLGALLVVICLGGLLIAVRTGLAIFEVRRIVTDAYVWRRTRTTDIRLSDSARVPFAARGLLRRHVVLPSHLLTSPEKLRIVLAHEFEHIRQRDLEWELALEFLRPLFYFNPAFVLWKREFNRLRELSCDQAVLRGRRISARDYARCLLAFCGVAPEKTAVPVFNVALVMAGRGAARAALEARLMALPLAQVPHRSRLLFPALVLALAVGIVLAAASVRNSGDWSMDRIMLSTVVNLERLRGN